MRNFYDLFRRFDRSILLYLFYWCMIAFAYFGVEGVLINIYLVRLGYGPEFIGKLLASGQLVWALCALPAGNLGGRYGVKQAMIVGLLIIAAATALMLLAESLPAAFRVGGLVAAWMLSWVGAALSSVNSAPYLMAVTTNENRSVAFSAQQAVMAAAGFAGSLLAGILPGVFASLIGVSLDHTAPYRLALLLAPAAYLVAAYAFQKARPVAPAVQSSGLVDKRGAPIGLFVFFGVVVFFQAFGEGLVRPFFNIYLDLSLGVPVAQIGSVLGFSSLLLILVSLVTPLVLRRWGTGGTLRLTSLGFAGFALLLAVLPHYPGAALVYLGTSSMLTVMATARGIFSQELVLPRWRTTISAVSTVGLALGLALSAWAGGILIESVGFYPLFIAGAVVSVLGGGLLFLRRDWAEAGSQDETGEPVAASS
jgi:MFS family permease